MTSRTGTRNASGDPDVRTRKARRPANVTCAAGAYTLGRYAHVVANRLQCHSRATPTMVSHGDGAAGGPSLMRFPTAVPWGKSRLPVDSAMITTGGPAVPSA